MQVCNIIEDPLKMLIVAPDHHISSVMSTAHFQIAFWLERFTNLKFCLRLEAKLDPPMNRGISFPVGLPSIIAEFQQVPFYLLMIIKALSDLVAEEFPSLPKVHSSPIAFRSVPARDQHRSKEGVEKAFKRAPCGGDPANNEGNSHGIAGLLVGFLTLLSSDGPKWIPIDTLNSPITSSGGTTT
jgi:hypothetical protein